MRELTIDGRRIADDTDCFVIAEIGHNHQGSVEKAQELFVLAKQCGVDAVKLQKRDNRRLFTRELFDSPYDNENSFGATYGEHREALELDRAAYAELQACARELGLVFFATAFDEASADLLEELDLPAYKIASGDLRNTPLLRHVASFGKPLIVSTGGATLEDVDRAVDAITALNARLCLLQCTAAYPAIVEELNLGVITTLRERYPELVIGLSDHQDGIRDGAGRLHARRTRDREALHGEPHREGHRPRVLADAGGHAEARPRPPARPGRDRRRGQAAAPERGAAASEDGEEARRRSRPPWRATCSRTATSSPSRRRTAGCRRTRSTTCSAGRSHGRSQEERRSSPRTSAAGPQVTLLQAGSPAAASPQ